MRIAWRAVRLGFHQFEIRSNHPGLFPGESFFMNVEGSRHRKGVWFLTEKEILTRYKEGQMGITEVSFLLRTQCKWTPLEINSVILEKERHTQGCHWCGLTPDAMPGEPFDPNHHDGWWRSTANHWWCDLCNRLAAGEGEQPYTGFCDPTEFSQFHSNLEDWTWTDLVVISLILSALAVCLVLYFTQ